ncbi:MAG: adenine-specific methyltransferase EcoRI family protein [Acutalibacteraceae bacterium]|nr:adenine-specific methyltransferase EcoRI family protein [Acutalibacteraceae bacterium]
MGVPITYLDRHNDEQFAIIGSDFDLANKMDLGNGKFGTGRFYAEMSKTEQDRARQSKTESAALQQNRHQEKIVSIAAELSEYQLPSLIDITPLNLKFLESLTLQDELDPNVLPWSKVRKSTTDSFCVRYCNGIMGVPITFLDKYYPKQFDIVGAMTTTKVEGCNHGYPYVNSKKIYARILVKQKRTKDGKKSHGKEIDNNLDS